MPTAFAVHCCQFYHPPTSAINCLAYDKSSKRIALSRADNSIEIWTLKSTTPCRERIFPYIENASVEALSWCRGRLFATGLDGFLREWSTNAFLPVNQLKITPSAAWCMDSNRMETHLAIGTEEGALLLIGVSSDDVHIEKCLTRSGDRIMSVAWSHDGRTIVTGSIGVIRLWDVLSGRCVSRMMVGGNQAGFKNLIWSIAVTKDPIIVTGDSRGVTSFWDCHTSTLINSYQSHTADVLAVCWSEDRNLVFSSGIDPSICQYHAVKEEIANKRQVLGDTSSSSSAWVTSADKRIQYVEHIRLNLHTHDVRCLISAGEWLVSGGVDGVLTFSKYPPKVVLNFYPFNPDNISVASRGQCMLLQYPEYLELWRLGSTEAQVTAEDGKILPLAKDPEKLAQIKCKNGTRILCSSLDDWGEAVAYSDGKKTFLYHIKAQTNSDNSVDESTVVIQPIKCLNVKTLPASTAMAFLSSTTLFISDEHGCVQRVDIDDVICRMEPVSQDQDGVLIKKLVCSNKKRSCIAAVTTDDRISVLDYEQKKVIADLPRMESPIVDIRFTASSKEIVMLCGDGRLSEFDYADWPKNSSRGVRREIKYDTGPLGLTVSTSKDNDALIVYGDDKLALISRLDDSSNGESTANVSGRFRHICKAELLSNGSLIIVQIDHNRYLADLPPLLKVKKYGTG